MLRGTAGLCPVPVPCPNCLPVPHLATAPPILPRLLRELKGRKPAFPGQTGDDIVTSLSCKLLNTTSCQGPFPTTPSPHTEALEAGWEGQAWAPPHQPRHSPPRRADLQTACWKHPAPREHTQGLLFHGGITCLSVAGTILQAESGRHCSPTLKDTAVPTVP